MKERIGNYVVWNILMAIAKCNQKYVRVADRDWNGYYLRAYLTPHGTLQNLYRIRGHPL
ncbi:MAG: hypothetical protein AAB393_08510 [Bacteroidota bacterium]